VTSQADGPGQRRGRVGGSGQQRGAAAQLLDRSRDLRAGSRQHAHVLRHGHDRCDQRAERGAGHRDGAVEAQRDATGALHQRGQRASRRHRDHGRAALERRCGTGQGLRRLARERSATTSERAPTNPGSTLSLTTEIGTGLDGPATAARTSPAIPLPPIPSTTRWSMAPGSGSPPIPSATAAAATDSWSPRPNVTSHIPRVSTRSTS
jgi:hypothetical protein